MFKVLIWLSFVLISAPSPSHARNTSNTPAQSGTLTLNDTLTLTSETSCGQFLKNIAKKSLSIKYSTTKHPHAPLLQQSTDYTCGPTSLLSWLKFQGDRSFTEMGLAEVLGTTEKSGTSYTNFLKGLRTLDFEASFEEDLTIQDLRDLLKQGYGVIVSLQSEGEGHWALLVDVSKSGQTLTFMDPWLAKKGYHRTGHMDFKNKWYDFFGRKRVRKNNAAIVIKPKQ